MCGDLSFLRQINTNTFGSQAQKKSKVPEIITIQFCQHPASRHHSSCAMRIQASVQCCSETERIIQRRAFPDGNVKYAAEIIKPAITQLEITCIKSAFYFSDRKSV